MSSIGYWNGKMAWDRADRKSARNPALSYSNSYKAWRLCRLDGHLAYTIVNDDPVPTVSVGDVSLPEGDAGTTDFMFTASLTNPIDQEATVRFMTVNQSAEDETGDGDFTAVDQTVTFPALQTQVTVVVAVNGDETFEGTVTTNGDETFGVTLSEHNNLLPNGDATGTIIDDDEAIQVTGAAVPGAIPEGLPGTIVTSINSVLGTQHTGVGLNLHFDSSQIPPALVDAFTTVFDGGFLTGGPQVLSDIPEIQAAWTPRNLTGFIGATGC